MPRTLSFLRASLLSSAVLLGACTDDGVELLVDLRTDVVPVDEMEGIRIEVTGPGGFSRDREVLLAREDDYVTGRRILELSGLDAGTYRATVNLVFDGVVIARRRTVIDLTQTLVHTVVIARDARACDPASCTPTTTCGIGTECIDERCSPDAPDTCPEAQCTAGTDCPERADCSVAVCVAGVCLYGADDLSCGADAWCNPDEGCIPRTSMPDASMPDAAPDAMPDGGCGAGMADCDGDPTNGCEQDVASDPRNCGTCGMRCNGGTAATPACVAGVCALSCDPGFGDCDGDLDNGCETSTDTTEEHCGVCGSVCPPTLPICAAGDCYPVPFPSDGSEGDFAPATDVTLSAGIHQFATIDIPMGVTVTVDGSGLLELRATGDVSIAGTIDLSGGDGGRGTNNGSGGGAAGGGSTGTRVDGLGVTAGICAPSGSGGTGGAGMDGTAACGDGGRNGGGAASNTGGGGGGGGAAGGAGGGWSGQSGGSGASSGGSSGGIGSVNMGGTGGEPGFGAYSGGDGGTNNSGGGGGGSIGSAAIADLAMTTTFGTGSGGGAGSGRSGGTGGGSGGGGGGAGGALRVASPTRITLAPTAQLLARGGNGGDGRGGGGAGSGGAIYLSAPELSLMGEIDTSGGVGGGAFESGGAGGDGGLGRIRLSVTPSSCTLGATMVPPVESGCVDTDSTGFVFIETYPD